MSKKKKHSTVNTKQLKAEKFNKFLRWIDVMLIKINVGIRAKDMPSNVLELMFQSKFIMPKLECDDVKTRNNQSFKVFVENIDLLIRHFKVKIKIEWFEDEITLKDLITDWLNFNIFCSMALNKIKNMSENDQLTLKKFMTCYKELINENNLRCVTMIHTSTLCYSDLSKEIVWGKLNINEFKLENKPQTLYILKGFVKKVEQKTFLKNEFNRIGCKVYTIATNLEPVGIKINLKDLGIGRDKEMEVYFQKHVYERLYERLDAEDLATINIELVKSLTNVEYVVNHKNARLIKYNYLGKTLGYFTFRILQDSILCSTFLFITNDSTPEGEKLNELTRLQKADKEYLKLDRLSAFAASDLRDNPKLMELFDKAGCAHLFEDEHKPIFRKVEFNKMADKLINYIDTDEEFE